MPAPGWATAMSGSSAHRGARWRRARAGPGSASQPRRPRRRTGGDSRLPVGELADPSRALGMDLPVHLDVRLGQRVHGLAVLPGAHREIAVTRPDDTPLVETAEIVIDLRRIVAEHAVGDGQPKQALVVGV